MPDYSTELAASRKAAKTTTKDTNKLTAREKDTPGIPIFAFLIGAINDIIDLPIIGSIPLLGDVLDLFTGLILIIMRTSKIITGDGVQFKKTAKAMITLLIASVVELIPGCDFLPSFSFAVFLNANRDKKNKREKK